uniref:Uncharacterized protein n=1 Tax=Anguilla anguilla TaxID=7936 RepID=A0A0E9XNB3_ANGAN
MFLQSFHHGSQRTLSAVLLNAPGTAQTSRRFLADAKKSSSPLPVLYRKVPETPGVVAPRCHPRRASHVLLPHL